MTVNTYNKNKIDEKFETKQDKLIAGDNITIASDGQTISANLVKSLAEQSMATAVTASGATTLTFDNTNPVIPVTMAADSTFTFNASAFESGKVYTFELYITMPTTAYTLTFPLNVTWLKAPDFSESDKKYIVVLRTYDAGTNWIANICGKF